MEIPRDYEAFLTSKLAMPQHAGLPVVRIPERLFPFQRRCTSWAVERGRAALFLDTGLGKTAQQLVWADNVASQAGKVLILAPLAVAQQTVNEGALMGIDVTLCRSNADVRQGINIANYERLHHFQPQDFSGIVLDECFAPGTPIDVATPDGRIEQKRIEDIRTGERIINASGIDTVREIHKREVPYAVKVCIAGNDYIASPNHPFFTQRGWVGARDLRPGDYALDTTEAMRLVCHHVYAETSLPERAAILRTVLLSEMADELPRASCESPYARNCSAAWCEKICMVPLRISGSDERNSAFTRNEFYGKSTDAPEVIADVTSHEPRTFRAWRQWTRADGATAMVDGGTLRGLAHGVCLITGQTDSRLSHMLQTGSGMDRAQDCHRSGWNIASFPEGIGYEKRRQTGFARVDSLAVLESGHPELERCRDASGKLYFYDIGATRHPSFSVNGTLVHNSSILKSFDGKTRTQLIDAFRHTPHRLCASATPSPNDLVELGNHSEFLGILSRSEMLATFYIHDGGNTSQWRLKGHAEEHYWQWVASWAIALTHPREIGDETPGYDLPPLERHEHIIRVDPVQNGLTLFPMEAYSLTEQRAAKKASLSGRIQKTLELVHSLPAHEPCIIWCELNTEQDTLATALGERAYSIYGSLSIEDKEKRLLAWLRQDRPILLTKPSIAGFGINMQHCAQMIFVGINNSFESWYQAVRRCWRFGQQRTVHVHMILADIEMAILRNLRRKEEEAQRMQRGMTGAILQYMQWAITQQTYVPTQPMQIPAWLVSDTTQYAHEESATCQPS